MYMLFIINKGTNRVFSFTHLRGTGLHAKQILGGYSLHFLQFVPHFTSILHEL